jgi:hypothetical protein
MGIVDAFWLVVVAGGGTETSRVAGANDVATSLPFIHSLWTCSLSCSFVICPSHRLSHSLNQNHLAAFTTSRAHAAYRCPPGADHTHHVNPSLSAWPCQRRASTPTARERAGRRLTHLAVCETGQGQRQSGGHGRSCSDRGRCRVQS